MYNRYIRNDSGNYTRIPQEDPPPKQDHPPPPRPKADVSGGERQYTAQKGTVTRVSDSITGVVRHLLDQLHLEHVDTGDLLLLLLLFFLFREDADEELLVALGVLLIL